MPLHIHSSSNGAKTHMLSRLTQSGPSSNCSMVLTKVSSMSGINAIRGSSIKAMAIVPKAIRMAVSAPPQGPE